MHRSSSVYQRVLCTVGPPVLSPTNCAALNVCVCVCVCVAMDAISHVQIFLTCYVC